MKNLFLTFLIASLLMAPYVAKAVDDTLVLHLSFDESMVSLTDKVARDSSTHGNDAEIRGDPELVEGFFGEAMKFHGVANEDVLAPYIPFNDTSFTIQMWINPPLTGGDQCVFAQHQSHGTNTSKHYRIHDSGRVRMGFYGNDLDTPDGVLKANEWNHLTFWYDFPATSRKLYVHDSGFKEVKVVSDAGAPYKGTAGKTVIGSWFDRQWSNCAIDNVKVWNRPLSNAEIEKSMETAGTEYAVSPSGKLTTTWVSIKK